MAELKGSITLQKIADRLESLRREYENIRRHIPEFEKYTLREFIWARLVVITRIFGLKINGHKTDGLVPYADMLNHKRPRGTTNIILFILYYTFLFVQSFIELIFFDLITVLIFWQHINFYILLI